MPIEKQSQLNLPRVRSASLPRFFLPLPGSASNNHERVMPESRSLLSARAIYNQSIPRISRSVPVINNLRHCVKPKERAKVPVETPLSTSSRPPLAPRRPVVSEAPTLPTTVPRLSFQPTMQIPKYCIVFGYEDSRGEAAQKNVAMHSVRHTNAVCLSPPLRRR